LSESRERGRRRQNKGGTLKYKNRYDFTVIHIDAISSIHITSKMTGQKNALGRLHVEKKRREGKEKRP